MSEKICRYCNLGDQSYCKVTEGPCAIIEAGGTTGSQNFCPCYNLNPELARDIFRARLQGQISWLETRIEQSKAGRFLEK